MTRFAQKTWRKVAVDLKPDVSDSSLWLGWLLKDAQSQTVPDVSGSSRDGLIGNASKNQTLLGPAFASFVRDKNVYVGTTPTTYNPQANCTISLWVSTVAIGAVTRWVANFYQDASNGWGIYQNQSSIGIYNDLSNANANLYATAVPAKLVFVVATLDDATGEQKLYIDGHLVGSGTNAASSLSAITAVFTLLQRANGLDQSIKSPGVVNPQIFSEVKDQSWVTSEYQKGARAIQFATDWGHDADGINRTTPEYLGNGPFEVADAGTFRCETDTINDQTVKAFTCNTPGHVVVDLSRYVSEGDASRGYGSWGCWFYVPDDGAKLIRWHLFNTVRAPAAASGNGYRVDLDGSGTADLVEQGVGNVIGGGALTPGQWNHCHVTRRYDGLFELFINDVSQGTGTDNTTAGARYMSFQMSADCKVAVSDPRGGYAITKYLGVVPPRM